MLKKTVPAPSDIIYLDSLDRLFTETFLLNLRLLALIEQVHGPGKFPRACRGILADLAENGPQTVPQLARTRSVSRQYIQTAVGTLVSSGWIEPEENPAHRRSVLMKITPSGQELIDQLRRREGGLLRQIDFGLSAAEIQAAAAVLAQVRAVFNRASVRRLVSDQAKLEA
jgi:DNA-binding MarR family transcriptional regulator